MYILNPDPYSLPCYRIGPFQTRDLSINHRLPPSNHIDDYLTDRFAGKDFLYTENARKAISLALGQLKLVKDDVVTILTTSGNFYISGCVTHEIEKFCKWNRDIVAETKVIFVNHEFGYPFKNLKELKKYRLPIIEDCANTFFSIDIDGEIGTVGDFVIYSFPKAFPLQVGGLLVANKLDEIKLTYQLNSELQTHIKSVLSHYVDTRHEIVSKRLYNYHYLKDKLASLGFSERFGHEQGVVPGVFMFKSDAKKINFPELKKYYYDHGVQCSVFYGEEAFFIPVHQALSQEDLDFFVEILKSYINVFTNEI